MFFWLVLSKIEKGFLRIQHTEIQLARMPCSTLSFIWPLNKILYWPWLGLKIFCLPHKIKCFSFFSFERMLSFHMEESRSAIIRHPTKRLQGFYVDGDYIYCQAIRWESWGVSGLSWWKYWRTCHIKLEFLGRLDLIGKKILSPWT